MRKTLFRTAFALVAAAAILAAPAPASAQTSLDRIVDRPAATLLLPYFEVGLNSTVDTRFTVNNASATAVLAHVTVWSDLAVPVLAFNIYLTGYDMQQISMKDLINGKLPRTASNGQDPGDTISNQGIVSQDINFASCSGQLPPPATLSAAIIAHTRNSLTGKASAIAGGRCAGRPSGAIARGFVTVDTVNNCTLRVAGDPGYFGAGGTGDATNQNVLWGDFMIITPGAKTARGDALVHITANATDPETSVPGEYTFYGRHVAWTAADNRQPLATSWAAPFRKQGLSGDVGTVADFPTSSLVVWRDPKVQQGYFSCGVLPSWFPLSEEGATIFNEAEDTSGMTVLNAFPAATQKVPVGPVTGIPTPYGAGWMYLNLNHVAANPPEDPLAAASFVYVIRDRAGFYSHGSRATALDSATNANHYTPN